MTFSRLIFVVAAIASAAFGIGGRAETRVIKDVAYRADADDAYARERCTLDWYLPAEGEGFATMVWFHGGALQNGDKADGIASGVGRSFAERGIAVASVNYRLSPKATFPAYVEDVAAAVAFVHAEVEKLGGAKDRVFVSGHSAGGYLTAMLAVDERYLKKHGLGPTDLAGYLPVSGQMITHSTVREERGVPRSRPIVDEAAPAWHAAEAGPPILCIAGSEDLPARAEENRWFAAAMKAAGRDNVTYAEFPGRDHDTIASRLDEPDDAVAAAMFAFIERAKR